MYELATVGAAKLIESIEEEALAKTVSTSSCKAWVLGNLWLHPGQSHFAFLNFFPINPNPVYKSLHPIVHTVSVGAGKCT